MSEKYVKSDFSTIVIGLIVAHLLCVGEPDIIDGIIELLHSLSLYLRGTP
jgi:hypothetical protein